MSYRNCVYNQSSKSIHLWTWNQNGERVKEEIDFKPYLYLESKNGEDKSIYGTNLKKREFETLWDRNKFVKDAGIKRLFENLPPYQQFLIDNYYLSCESDDFSKHPLKVMFLDIECPTSDKFPEPETAEAPINLITCYDTLTKKYTMFGLKKYETSRKDVKFYHCKSEEDLLKMFIGHFSSDYPDVLCGYNCIEGGQHVWMDDKIIKIDKLSNLYKNNPLKTYGGRLNIHMATGKKRAFRVTDMLGMSVTASSDHKFIVNRKLKSEYKYITSLTANTHELTISDMMEDFKESDFYCRRHIATNNNVDYSIRDYIIDNFSYLKESEWFNFQITSEKIRDRLKDCSDVRTLIPIDDYWWGKNFWKRTHKWSYKFLKDYIYDDEILEYIKDEDVIIFCNKLQRSPITMNKPIPDKLLQLLGYMFTDGTYDKYSDRFDIASKHRSLIESYVNIINIELDKQLLGSKPGSYNGVKHKTFTYNNLLGLMIPIIYDNTDKHPNIEILSRLSRNQFLHFFAGMMDGDGYVSHCGINLCNYDCERFNFLNDMSELLFWNGIPSRLYKNILNIPSWHINIDNIGIIKTLMMNTDRISKFSKIKWKTIGNSPAKIKSFFYDAERNDLIVRIKKIEDMGYDVDMYDITTDDHTFLCNGMLVHNCNAFDIPYLVNRITFELGKEWADELSPIGRIYEKINQEGKFGMPTKEYVIEGISCIDYYVMYMKFAINKLESYKLDYVAEVELGEKKIQYDGSLWDLCKTDWNKFCDYNLVDVELLVKLDDKLRYVELLRFISYLGMCNMENAIKTVPVVNGAIAVRSRHRGEKIPTFIKAISHEKIPGAYVAEPKLGFSENIVSFDANSLYPSVMISLNMSPETKVGSVEKIDDNYHIHHVSGRTFELSKENYIKFIKEEKLARSEYDILFTQKKKGLFPEFLDFLYTKRKEMKGKMIKLKRKFEEEKKSLPKKERIEMETMIQKYDTFQHAYKITLNSVYGYCAEKYAPMGDKDIGKSVTLTGQSVIKHSNDLFRSFIKENYPDVYDKVEDGLIYNDTDSVMGDTLLSTPNGEIKIQELWDNTGSGISLTEHGHEMKDLSNVYVSSCEFINSDYRMWNYSKVKRIFRHKVNKRKFKIKYEDKEVIMTEDHGLMVYRDGKHIRISPKDYKKGDKIVIETQEIVSL